MNHATIDLRYLHAPTIPEIDGIPFTLTEEDQDKAWEARTYLELDRVRKNEAEKLKQGR